MRWSIGRIFCGYGPAPDGARWVYVGLTRDNHLCVAMIVRGICVGVGWYRGHNHPAAWRAMKRDGERKLLQVLEQE